MRVNKTLVRVGLLIALGATPEAEQRGSVSRAVPPPSGLSPGLTFSAPWRPAGATGDTRIMGTVIDIRQVPVSKVKVQLRNLETGEVTESTETNANGEYEFDEVIPNGYVVEMVLAGGYVISLSNAGSVGRYETLQTVIQLPGRWDSVRQSMLPTAVSLGFVGMSSQTTMTIATLAIAVTQNISPISAGEPVSPLR